jgi:hypothetical protein
MKIITIEKNIHHFIITKSHKILLSVKNDISINNEIVFKSPEGLQYLNCLDNEYIFTNTSWDGKGFILNLNDNKNTSFINLFIKHFDKDHKILSDDFVSLFFDLKNNIESMFNFKIMRYIADFKQNLLVNYDFEFPSNKREKIDTYSIFPNTLISSFPLSKLGTYNHGAGEQPYKVALFAGMYQNTLVCTVQWGGVLLLDVQTGEAIKFLKEAPAVYYLYPSAVDSPVYWSLEYTKFAEIDVAKAEILRDIELRPQLDAMAIQYGIQAGMLDIVTSVCYDGIIYFIAGGYFLGVFDPVSATIIDHHHFKFHKNGHRLRSGKEFLQVQGKEIYILDTEGTLHVMERE